MIVTVKICFNFSSKDNGEEKIYLDFSFLGQHYNEKLIEEINRQRLRMKEGLKKAGYSDVYVSFFSISFDRENLENALF